MGTPLTGTTPASTYTNLLKVAGALAASLRRVEDGAGSDSALAVSTAGAKVFGDFEVTGALAASGASLTGLTWAQIGSRPTTLAGYGIADAQPLDAALTALSGLTTTAFGRALLGLSGQPAAAAAVLPPQAAAAGKFLTSDGAAAAWATIPSGAVSSVFGRAGAVTAQSGDYTAAQVGADPAGTAAGLVSGLAAVAASGAYADLTGRPTLGTAAAHPASDFESPLTFSGGLTRTLNAVTADTTQNTARLSNFTADGFLKTTGGDGTLAVDSTAYLTGNQTVTLSGDVTGSGSTAIAVTIGAAKVTAAMLAGSIPASKLVGTDIATVGTVTAGTWNGTPVANAYLANSSVTLSGHTVSLGGSLSLAAADVSGLAAVATSGAYADLSGRPTLGTAAAQNATAFEAPLTFSGGLTRSTNTVTVDTSQAIAKLSNLTANGFVKTSAADGTLVVDTSTYLTGNQTVTLSGDVSGSGATAITVAIGAGKVTNAMLAGAIAAAKLVGTDIATVGTVTAGTWQGTPVANAYLANSAVTVTAGAGLSGGGAVSLGGSVTLAAAVTSVAGRTGAVALAAADVSGLAAVATSGSASDLSAGTLGTARGGLGVDASAGGTANTFFARPDGSAGAASFRAIVAADVPTLNQSTTGSAATLTTPRTLWGQSFDGSAGVSGSLTGVGDITGGASSMALTAGTGNSRTLTFRTTTSGGVATTALTLAADQSATFANTVNATTFVGALTGNASGSSGSCTGNAATATALQTARAINGVSFDGTAAITVAAAAGTLTGSALASGVTASSLTSVGTLTGGATGAGFTLALGTSTLTGTLPAAQMPALTGDVTTSAGAVATTIGAGKVTNAMLAGGIDLTAKVTGILPAANGGTANGFFAVSGPATSTRTFTFPNASATVLTTNAAVTEAQGGTNQTTYATGDTLYASAANTLSKLSGSTSATMAVLTQTGNGTASAAPAWTSTTGTGNVVRATSPTLVTPALGTPSALTLTNATGLPFAGVSGLSAGVLLGRTSASAGVAQQITVGSGLSLSGTTLSATASGGTVTSVDASGGTTGLSFSGGPVTGSGTLTLAGTLALANGGTGATTQAGAAAAVLPAQTGFTAPILCGDGVNIGWVESGIYLTPPAEGITVSGSPATYGAGAFTLALANDLLGLEGLTGTGFAKRTAADTWATAAVDLTADVSGILPVANGGTNNAFFTVSGPATSAKTYTFPNASCTVLTSNALVTAAQGGTGNGFFAVSGPATSTKTFTFPNASATVLTSNAAVTEAQGGTNQTTYATGDTLYASASNTLSKLSGNTTTTRKFLRQTGNGSVSAAPAWDTLTTGDMPSGVPTAAATQAEQEAGSSTTVYVTPGRQHYHPSALKAWVYFTVSGTTVTVQRSYNVSSVTRSSVGAYVVNFTTGFSDTKYGANVTPDNLNGTGNLTGGPTTRATGSLTFVVTLGSGTLTDPSGCTVSCEGDQ